MIPTMMINDKLDIEAKRYVAAALTIVLCVLVCGGVMMAKSNTGTATASVDTVVNCVCQ